MAIPSSRMSILHGHGAPGYMQLEQSNGSSSYLYSENASSGSVALDFNMSRNSYIMFITCKGAAASDSRKSLIDAAFSQGARCVTGYSNNVAGGEDYFEIMMNYIQKYPSMTLREAMLNADNSYTAEQRQSSSCPANPGNRCTYGNPNFSINMN